MASFIPNITDQFPEPALYTPDFSFLDKMLRRRQSMYDQGFAQVASSYQGINRELTNPVNAQIRDKFLKEAMGNLKNLSSMDLSEQQNVQAASNVFTPFVKNQAVLRDMGLTQHWNSQIQLAEGSRNKDGGKDFSQDNLNYILQQKGEFAKDTPDNWQTYSQSKRYFTPYHDYTKEYREVMKDFKPTSIKTLKENGLYLNTIDDKSWTEREISKYLDGVLSTKAKEQMRIEASVRLGGNPEQLASMYTQEGTQQLLGLKNHVEQLNTYIQTEKDPAKLAELKANRDYYLDKGKTLTNTLSNIQNGDMSFINKNKEGLAYQMYYGQTIKKAAAAYAHKDIDQSIGFDQVKMMYARFNHAEKMAKYTADRADERELKKENKGMVPLVPITVESTEYDKGLDSLKKDAETAKASSIQHHDDLTRIISAQLHNGDGSQPVTDQEYNSWTSRNANNPKFKASIQASELAINTLERVEKYKSEAETFAKQQMKETYGELEKYREAQKTAQTQQSASVKWDDAKGTFIKTIMLPNGQPTLMDVGKYYYEKNNGISQADLDKKNAANFIVTANGITPQRGKELEETYKALKNKWNTDANVHTQLTENAQLINNTDPRYKTIMGYLGPIAEINEPDVSKLVIIPRPTGNDIAFKISDASLSKITSPVSIDNTIERLKVQFKGAKVTKGNDGMIRVSGLGNIIFPQLDPYLNVPQSHKVGLQNLESSHHSVGGSEQTNFTIDDPSGRPRTFRITKVFSKDPSNDSYYVYGDGTTEPIFKGNVYDNIHDVYQNTVNLITSTPSSTLDQYFNTYKK